MSFGEFSQRVLDICASDSIEMFQSAIRENAFIENAFNKLFYGYTMEVARREQDWEGRIKSTAFEIKNPT